MKKNILFFILIVNAIVSQGQSIRNSILGTYSGTYFDGITYASAGVKITTLNSDTAGFITHDTINNVIDTLFVFMVTNNNLSDTLLRDCCHGPCGDIIPSNDSIFFSHYNSHSDLNPSAEFQLICFSHAFPTTVKIEETIVFNMYPNPVNSVLIIETAKYNIQEYTIYNLKGQIVKYDRPSVVNRIELDISDLPIGSYSLKLKDDKNEIVKVFVKN